jgi:hypothetical protein
MSRYRLLTGSRIGHLRDSPGCVQGGGAALDLAEGFGGEGLGGVFDGGGAEVDGGVGDRQAVDEVAEGAEFGWAGTGRVQYGWRLGWWWLEGGQVAGGGEGSAGGGGGGEAVERCGGGGGGFDEA